MGVLSFLPHPDIAAYISDIVVIENNNLYKEVILPLIPRGSPSITFQITNPWLTGGTRIDNLVLYGQHVRPIELRTSGYVIVIAYFLYPHMLKGLFGYDAKELTDASIDLDLTEPARGMCLQEQLLNAPDLRHRMQLIDNFIRKLAAPCDTHAGRAIAHATQLIQQGHGTLPVNCVQQELHTTERTLQRLFEAHVGVSPKTFSRICQFHAALQQLSHNNFTDMTAVAFDNGYADQSHLIRAFKEFTHYSPLEYLKLAEDFPR
ncbi:MAG TPA: helix-turn-helix domain-containing protein [Chitinophaga sp.]|uniref:AraC family transcriptional regulator n=1 Tax=Chitinophaga sp. TaxID=1869181 RepID=UPI002C168C60|nr:helix-turn-helix domain-containing protein [Chitinophaga sp.]HVI44186.1 helix-turn-helix domain-containing protein [Chitinophaga sp.]